jgi:hypothetical protein
MLVANSNRDVHQNCDGLMHRRTGAVSALAAWRGKPATSLPCRPAPELGGPARRGEPEGSERIAAAGRVRRSAKPGVTSLISEESAPSARPTFKPSRPRRQVLQARAGAMVRVAQAGCAAPAAARRLERGPGLTRGS